MVVHPEVRFEIQVTVVPDSLVELPEESSTSESESIDSNESAGDETSTE